MISYEHKEFLEKGNVARSLLLRRDSLPGQWCHQLKRGIHGSSYFISSCVMIIQFRNLCIVHLGKISAVSILKSSL
jgi:hypothetical protein